MDGIERRARRAHTLASSHSRARARGARMPRRATRTWRAGAAVIQTGKRLRCPRGRGPAALDERALAAVHTGRLDARRGAARGARQGAQHAASRAKDRGGKPRRPEHAQASQGGHMLIDALWRGKRGPAALAVQCLSAHEHASGACTVQLRAWTPPALPGLVTARVEARTTARAREAGAMAAGAGDAAPRRRMPPEGPALNNITVEQCVSSEIARWSRPVAREWRARANGREGARRAQAGRSQGALLRHGHFLEHHGGSIPAEHDQDEPDGAQRRVGRVRGRVADRARHPAPRRARRLLPRLLDHHRRRRAGARAAASALSGAPGRRAATARRAIQWTRTNSALRRCPLRSPRRSARAPG